MTTDLTSPAAAAAPDRTVEGGGDRGARSRVRPSRRRRRVDWHAYLYIAPAVVLFAVFVITPLIQTVELSFFQWDGLTTPVFIGIGNYVSMIQDPLVLSGYLHALVLVVFFCALPIGFGLLLTGVLTRRTIRGFAFFRTALFLPQVIATVVIAVVWRYLYAPDGPIDAVLQAVGLGNLAIAWLGDFTWALPAIGFIGTWVLTGFCLVLFLTGAQQIPTELYDAVRLDGAGPVREFLAITLPGLRGVLVIAGTLTLTAAIKTFDLVYVTTGGGPGTSSIVPGVLVYQNAFGTGRTGYAAAIAVVLLIVVFAVTFLIQRLGPKEQA